MNPKQTAFDLKPPNGDFTGPVAFGGDAYVLVVDPVTNRGYVISGDGKESGLKDNTVYALSELSTLIETRPDEEFADADEDDEESEGDEEESDEEEGDEEDEDEDDDDEEEEPA